MSSKSYSLSWYQASGHFSALLTVHVCEHYTNPRSVAVLVEMEVVKIKCFLVCWVVLSDPLKWGRQTSANTEAAWSWASSRAGILFMSASRRPTSTRLNGFLWHLGIFMASSDSMGFTAETAGSSKGGTATRHCRSKILNTSKRGHCFASGVILTFGFVDVIWNISLFWCSATLDYISASFWAITMYRLCSEWNYAKSFCELDVAFCVWVSA